MITAILAKIGLGKILGGIGIGAVLYLAKKYIPDQIGKWFAGELQKALNPQLADPIEKEKFTAMVKAICVWVEYKIPDTPGHEKFAKVEALLTRFVSKEQADKIIDIIEEAVKRMNDELKKAGQK